MASNHSFGSFDENFDLFAQKKNIPALDGNAPKKLSEMLGATGKFPNGKLTDSDEGEIQFQIGSKDGTIIIDFGKPVAWLGVQKEQAIEIAKALCKHAGVVMTIEV
jgi:hypothetical protein